MSMITDDLKHLPDISRGGVDIISGPPYFKVDEYPQSQWEEQFSQLRHT